MDTDMDMLVPPAVAEDHVKEFEESEMDFSRTLCKLGITQLVLGVIAIAGGIATTIGSIHEDSAGEGIWCGAIVLICGALAITSRYRLQSGVVIASFVCNLVASLVLLAGLILGSISTFHNLFCDYCWGGVGKAFGFAALNGVLISCIILTIYMIIVYGKILNEKTNFVGDCCQKNLSQNPNPYTMVYVPPNQQQPNVSQEDVAFLAAPRATAPTQMHQ